MMPRLIVHERAVDDVTEIANFIAEQHLGAALRFYDAAQAAFAFLSENPGAGPAFDPPLPADETLRFWPITRYRNYLVIYRPVDQGVQVLRVLQGARDIRSMFRGA
jgi:toxin ParE1/3/4